MKRFQLLTIFMLLAVVASAQRITVKNFGQANQFIASENQLRDWDNELCALIKIQGAKIDSVSGAFDVVKHAAETWVYMTNGDKKLTIFKQGYEPKEVAFNEFGVDEVKSNKVYLMTVYAPPLTRKKLFIGLFGGVNFSTASKLGPEYVGSFEMLTGFHFGANASYMFSENFGASVGMFFMNKGYKYTDDEIILDEKGEYQFFEIPVQATVRFNLSKAIALQFLAGPYFSINVGGKTTSKGSWRDDKFSDDFSVLQMGVQGGLKFIFADHYAIGADYQYGFTKYENQNICVNVGYIF